VAAWLASRPDAEGAVVFADQQTAGRGRRGRQWFSPVATGLYVSVVLTPARARTDCERATMLLPLAAGVALAEAVEIVSGLRLDLKWPNDLYVAGRKVGGILAEAIAAGGSASPGVERRGMTRRAASREVMNVVVGYGINICPASFPTELAGRATSLESELGRPVDRTHLFVETLAALSHRYDDLLDGQYDAILDGWRARAPSSIGRRVAWTTMAGVESGVTAGIDEGGALLIRTADRVERVVAGELTWL
jgi:BirA family biotin operon repressor/biotin-[acetyl-CoA-carboxylase] ligase